MNKKLILLLLLFLTIFACSTKTEKPIPEKQLEGWAGNPDNPNEKPFDYFYMKSTARASQKSIDKKNGEMMKKTCVHTATSKSIVRDIIKFLIKENIDPFCQSTQEKDYKNYLQIEVSYYSNSLKENFHLTNASDYECNSPRYNNLVKEYSEHKIKEVKVIECKSLYPDNPEFSGSGWRECECTISIHIPGGRDGIIARAKEIESK